jgi:general nucleoside transport system permease protein
MDILLPLLAPAVLIGIAASGIRLATPYLFASIGETLGQLSGVLNLGVEGIMLLSGFSAYYVVITTGNLGLGLLAAMLTGLIMGFLTAVISVTLKAEQGISGIGIYLFGLGMSDLLFKVLLQDRIMNVAGFAPLRFPILSDLPVVGPIFFNHNLLTYIAFALVPVAWFVINKTTWGLQIKAVGQNPAAADSLGINVNRVRYFTVTAGGVLSGVAGASLSIALLNIFQSNLTNGIGFISVALVFFGAWRPAGILLGSLLFSLVNALQFWMQALNVPIPSDLAVALPYVLTILALLFAAKRVTANPSALTKPFTRGV